MGDAGPGVMVGDEFDAVGGHGGAEVLVREETEEGFGESGGIEGEDFAGVGFGDFGKVAGVGDDGGGAAGEGFGDRERETLLA